MERALSCMVSIIIRKYLFKSTATPGMHVVGMCPVWVKLGVHPIRGKLYQVHVLVGGSRKVFPMVDVRCQRCTSPVPLMPDHCGTTRVPRDIARANHCNIRPGRRRVEGCYLCY